MRKTLLTTLAAALAASAAFAEVPLKALKDLPKDAYIPADVTFIEGADDETHNIFVKLMGKGEAAARRAWMEREGDTAELDI